MLNLRTLALCALLANGAFADMYIDLSKQSVTCNGFKITNKVSQSDIMKNCRVIDTDTDWEIYGKEHKIKFIADGNNMPVKCKFLNGNLQMCYFDD